jgi:hypothetical protein
MLMGKLLPSKTNPSTLFSFPRGSGNHSTLMKEKDMGKLKNALIQFEEHRASKQKPILDPRYRGLEDSDEAWALYEAEFNDWLDKYEASFGDDRGYLP